MEFIGTAFDEIRAKGFSPGEYEEPNQNRKETTVQILTSIAGSFPRVGSGSIGNELRKARHKFDKGEISAEEVVTLENQLVREIVALQEEAGMDLITDGLVRWYDPVSHVARRLGAEIGELHHLAHTNFHVRKAIFKHLPSWQKPILKEEIDFLKTCTTKPLAVLPSADFLMRYTENKTIYPDQVVRYSYEAALWTEANHLENVYWMFGKNPQYTVIPAVDAFTAKEENPKAVAKKILPKATGDVLLVPNWSLEVLPRKYAIQKMKTLTLIKGELCSLLQ